MNSAYGSQFLERKLAYMTSRLMVKSLLHCSTLVC